MNERLLFVDIRSICVCPCIQFYQNIAVEFSLSEMIVIDSVECKSKIFQFATIVYSIITKRFTYGRDMKNIFQVISYRVLFMIETIFDKFIKK